MWGLLESLTMSQHPKLVPLGSMNDYCCVGGVSSALHPLVPKLACVVVPDTTHHTTTRKRWPLSSKNDDDLGRDKQTIGCFEPK